MRLHRIFTNVSECTNANKHWNITTTFHLIKYNLAADCFTVLRGRYLTLN